MAPVLTILAGSNGCGKSTLTTYAREEFQQSPILDPDAFARSIRSVSGQVANIDAGKAVLRAANDLIASQQSFTVETTLSGGTYLRMAERARQHGFLISVVFVGTTSVEINLERVKARVLKGGHDIPEEDQRRRFPRTLANIAKLLAICDFAVLLDNSTIAGYSLVGFSIQRRWTWMEPVPVWAKALRPTAS